MNAARSVAAGLLRPRLRGVAIAASLVALLGVGSATTTSASAPAPEAAAPAAAPAVSYGIAKIKAGFQQPVFVTNAGDSRLFVVERTGRIKIVKQVSGTWVVSSTFLNLASRITSAGQEQGLLGLAFAPDYASSGLFYVDYTDRAGDTVIAEFHRGSVSKADPSSFRQVLKVHQPYNNHNGGWIGFKGNDLYIALGDGGSEGDPHHYGQSLSTNLAKILRIDPRDPDGSGPRHYSIPADNPFVGKPGLDTIWAYGLRNPWRDSFDPVTGDLWIGDVGQDRYEEIDHHGTAKGLNFGWSKLEGRHLYPSGKLCTSNCKTLPIAEIPHNGTSQENCAIAGGYVSRRTGAPLYGKYVFGDFCSGRIWAIPTGFNGGALPTPLDTTLAISSFGVGADGTIYVVSLGGSIYRLTGS